MEEVGDAQHRRPNRGSSSYTARESNNQGNRQNRGLGTERIYCDGETGVKGLVSRGGVRGRGVVDLTLERKKLS